jgi:hypothetical protein
VPVKKGKSITGKYYKDVATAWWCISFIIYYHCFSWKIEIIKIAERDMWGTYTYCNGTQTNTVSHILICDVKNFSRETVS